MFIKKLNNKCLSLKLMFKGVLLKLKKFAVLILFCFGTFLSKILYLIFVLKRVSAVLIRENRIGHQVGTLDSEIFIANERKKIKNQNTIFIFAENEENLASKYFREITPKIINRFGFKYIIFGKYFGSKFINFFLNNFLINSKRFYRSSATLTPRLKEGLLGDHNTAIDILNKLEIEKEKYICIYCRDSNYLKNRFPEFDWSYHNHRNSDIDNMEALANYILEETNLEVVRVGSNVETPIKWSKKDYPKIIDYSFSKYLNDKNDIDLISSCAVFISSAGGPESIAVAARKPLLRFNQTPILFELGYQHGIYLPKLIRNKKSNKIIGIREAINLGICNSYNYYDYENIGLFTEENKSIDILNAFKDYIKYKNEDFNSSEISIIDEYKKLRKENEQKGYILAGYENFIAPSFLLKYPDILK